MTNTTRRFTFWRVVFRIAVMHSQAARSNYRAYLHVLKYLLYHDDDDDDDDDILKQKGVTQTNTLADV